MGKTSNIDYVDATWNPWQGCHHVSEGCQNCYMYREKRRWGQDPTKVVRSSDKTFYAPLKWKEPKRIMVCSWSDFFVEEAEDWFREAVDIIRSCEQHTFIIPTKRTERMICSVYGEISHTWFINHHRHIPNIWFLASIENQKTADKRIPELLRLRDYGDWPVLGISAEPLLGAIDLSFLPECGADLDWIIAGGESGPAARPCHPDWVRALRDLSQEAGVPFFWKQWGEYAPCDNLQKPGPVISVDKKHIQAAGMMTRVGKKAAGYLLDGREWHQFPGGRKSAT